MRKISTLCKLQPVERFNADVREDMFGESFYSCDMNAGRHDDDEVIADEEMVEDDRRCRSATAVSWTRHQTP